MTRVLRYLFIVLTVLIVLATGMAAWGWKQYQGFLNTPMPVAEAVIDIPTGSSYPVIVQSLSKQGGANWDWRWRLLGRLDPRAGRLQAGEYLFEQALTPEEFLEVLEQGRVRMHRFTLVEGWTFRQLRQALAEDAVLIDEHSALSDESLMEALGLNGHPEGRFLPETYSFPRGHSSLDVLADAATAMESVLAAQWQQRRLDLPLSDPYEMLILASIVERETGKTTERKLVAGVFINRLRRNMRLQTDPTVIYGMGEAFDGNIRRRDLRTDTPYNTYTRHGLPPTPIAMPGEAALAAVAQPAETDYLYFVSRNDGSHVFSTNLADHNRAVNRFQRGGGSK
jgi:UPF0755 protein